MKVCLVHPPQPNSLDDRLDIPLGQLYLATALEGSGFEVRVADLSSLERSRWPELIGYADIYGFTVYTTSYYIVQDILQIVKKINPDAVTVAGGAHPSALPQETLRDFDYVVIGEGELALLDLVSSLEKGVPLNGRIISKPLIEDLDSLSFPNLGLVDIHSYHRKVDGLPSLSFVTSRGCPNSCSFCCNFMFGKKIRFRSLDNVAREISLIKEKYGVKNFIFYDDTLTINRNRVREISLKLAPLDIRFRANGRVEINDKAVFSGLYSAGCRNIAFGVESGSEALLRKMKKRIKKDDIRRAIANAQEAGLIVKVFLIVGFPGESYSTIQETIDLMLECRPDQYTVFNFAPFPGCDVWNNPRDYGITYFEKDFRQYFNIAGHQDGGLTIETAGMKRGDVAQMRRLLLGGLAQLKWRGDMQDYQYKLDNGAALKK
jgi:anaerobic magnesium-protoporphyrin IX monomethyl ester cyclase